MSNADKIELGKSYEAIFLAYFRRKIDRGERNARIVALRDSPQAEGLSHEEREVIANDAVTRAADIMDEVHFSPSRGTWQ